MSWSEWVEENCEDIYDLTLHRAYKRYSNTFDGQHVQDAIGKAYETTIVKYKYEDVEDPRQLFSKIVWVQLQQRV